MTSTISLVSNGSSVESCQVYLVEDDAGLRYQLARTLSEAGLKVSEFASAEDFLVCGLADHSPSVIISDMVLPGRSGIYLFEKVRDAGIQTPIIFISGYSEPSQIIEGMKLGAVDFLWKPFKSDALLRLVMQSLVNDMKRLVHSAELRHVEMRWASLSDREQDVCKLMLRGYGNKDIAEQLSIQPDTVNKHRMKVLMKMGATGRPQLIELLKSFKPAQE